MMLYLVMLILPRGGDAPVRDAQHGRARPHRRDRAGPAGGDQSYIGKGII